MSKRKVPIDFYSWHSYEFDPDETAIKAKENSDLLDKYGYVNTENHCNEWNYVKD